VHTGEATPAGQAILAVMVRKGDELMAVSVDGTDCSPTRINSAKHFLNGL
jgi:hypothetical protein